MVAGAAATPPPTGTAPLHAGQEIADSGRTAPQDEQKRGMGSSRRAGWQAARRDRRKFKGANSITISVKIELPRSCQFADPEGGGIRFAWRQQDAAASGQGRRNQTNCQA